MPEYILEPPVKSNEICSPTMVRRVAAMLDIDTHLFSEGDILPRGWHFFMLAGETRKSALRQDGFPGLGVSMPDLALPRLLLGGRTVNYQGDIIIGSTIERSSFVKEIKEKNGQSGRIAIVTIQHELRSISEPNPNIIETQTYILLEDKNNQKKESLSIPLPIAEGQGGAKKQLIPDETLLFQYSALGFNSHKIHLDRDYARNVEGLPDLVVNGGLTTLLLTEFIRNDLKLDLAEIKVKHLAPLFCNRPLTLSYDKGEIKVFNDKDEVAVIMEHRTAVPK